MTVPNEDRVEVSGELKRLLYEPIVQEGRQNGWRVIVWAVEVGVRGFPAMSMSTLLKDLGLKGGERKRAIERIGKVAEEATWQKRQVTVYGRPATSRNGEDKNEEKDEDTVALSC